MSVPIAFTAGVAAGACVCIAAQWWAHVREERARTAAHRQAMAWLSTVADEHAEGFVAPTWPKSNEGRNLP